MRIISNIGLILTAVYLILVGLIAIIPTIAIPPMVMGIVAIAAGIFLLIGR